MCYNVHVHTVPARAVACTNACALNSLLALQTISGLSKAIAQQLERCGRLWQAIGSWRLQVDVMSQLPALAPTAVDEVARLEVCCLRLDAELQKVEVRCCSVSNMVVLSSRE